MSRKTFLILFAAWLSQGPAAEAQTPATFSFNTNCFTTTTNYFYVREEQTNAFIRVNRCGDTSGTVSVHYATRDGTATAGLDYVTTSGTLTFSPGETEAGFSVPIIFDDVAESIETVNLTLSDPTGGAVLGPVSTAVLGIADSSPFIQIGFSSTAFAVSETDSSALVTVSRQGSTSRTVTVQFAASTGS